MYFSLFKRANYCDQVINTVDFHYLEHLDNHTLYSRIIHHLPELFISVVISSLVELDNVL